MPDKKTEKTKKVKNPEDVIHRVMNRVWELLREDLRRDAERQGTRFER